MDFLLREGSHLLWTARERLAQFLGGEPKRLVFTANVTAAINIVAASLRLSAPGEILLTDHEYGAMHWCWERAAQRLGLTLRTFALPAMCESTGEIVEALEQALHDKTRLLFFSHVLSPTGMVLPAQELCAAAKKHGILTVIDGAHTPGMIPVALDDLGCDFYGGNCHKWLLAPTGSGFLYLGKGNEDRLHPLQVSWGWHHGQTNLDECNELGSTLRIRALEFEGTRDFCPWLAVPAAIDFQAGLGWDSIRKRNGDLAAYVRESFAKIPGLRPATPAHPALHGFMTAFWLPAGTDANSMRKCLWEQFRIEVPIVDRPEGLLIRVSTHFFNTEEEIDRLAEALFLLGTFRQTNEP